MAFTDTQVEALRAPLPRSNVKTRQQAGRSLSYIEAWKAIEEANRIFGFGEWSSETIECRCVSEKPRKIGKGNYEKDGHGVSYVARVRITVKTPDGLVTREGVGAGHGIDADLGLAHESAIKESESDARKRALMTFGNPFGLALYDKDQENVSDDTPETRAHERAPARQEPEVPAAGNSPAPVDSKKEALDRRTQAAIRSAELQQYAIVEGKEIFTTLRVNLKEFRERLDSGERVSWIRRDWDMWLPTTKMSAPKMSKEDQQAIRDDVRDFLDDLKFAEKSQLVAA